MHPHSVVALRTSILILVAGCAAETTSDVDSAELCTLAETAPSDELRLEVAPGDLMFELVGHAAVLCAEGECCNPAIYTPCVSCPADERVCLFAEPTYATEDAGTSAPSLECEGDLMDAPLATDPSRLGSPPPPECPEPTCDGLDGPVVLVGRLDEHGSFLVSDWEAR